MSSPAAAARAVRLCHGRKVGGYVFVVKTDARFQPLIDAVCDGTSGIVGIFFSTHPLIIFNPKADADPAKAEADAASEAGIVAACAEVRRTVTECCTFYL